MWFKKECLIFESSHIELSKSALRNNIKFLRKTVAKNRRLSVVVKGNAYGHGIQDIVPMLEDEGIDHFCVFSAQEAYEVFKVASKHCSIVIMGDMTDEAIEWAISEGIEFYVFDFNRLKKAYSIAKEKKKKALIHLEVETGMNRTGFDMNEYVELAEYLKEKDGFFRIIGLCTHFAGAESVSNYIRIKNQIKKFKKAQEILVSFGIKVELTHAACSAASLRYPQVRFDMVRIGILTYGFWPSQEVYIEYLTKKKTHKNPLERVISWKSFVMNIKKVKLGEYIGYGTSFQANENKTLALIPVGYETGFSRNLSNQGKVLIRGQTVPVVGIVNMNLCSVDITRIQNVKEGDEVVIIGKQGENEATVSSFSDMSNLLNYELLTRLPTDIPRQIVL